ncbi:peptide ABC transporter ATP-binding protein [Spirochaetia bacterium]|nr:peptide ABC transporter ATP-binding protein [Spirochaetia bacterium]
MADTPAILTIDSLKQYFPVKGRHRDFVKAVDGVSFSVRPGETFGLVGESGCGKSTLARCVLRVYEPTGGRIFLDGDDITHLPPKRMGPYRKKMQMIFQDPYSSLNSRMSVRDILLEPLIGNKVGLNAVEQTEMAATILEHVGLPKDTLDRYPHEFSGGQRQRIGIARALILRPKLVVCDEPISALDVSIQAQVINMLLTFQRELNCAYLFIAHDLSMVRYVSGRVGVMYLGQLVELCEGAEIYRNPLHPYTQALLEAIPTADPKGSREKNFSRVVGEVPSPINPPAGCRFHTRCSRARPICAEQQPETRDINGHLVSCHLY